LLVWEYFQMAVVAGVTFAGMQPAIKDHHPLAPAAIPQGRIAGGQGYSCLTQQQKQG
jgi:hypothetical protein